MYADNDYYLIYLIKNHHEEALEYLLYKYTKVFYSKLNNYNFTHEYKMEILSECFSNFPDIINRFDDKKGNFCSYALVVLRRIIIKRSIEEAKYYKNINQYCFDNNEDFYTQYNSYELGDDLSDFFKSNLNEMEYKIFKRRIIYNQGVDFIAKSLEIENKKVYNVLCKIKALTKDKYI